jgi:hypothetical protein
MAAGRPLTILALVLASGAVALPPRVVEADREPRRITVRVYQSAEVPASVEQRRRTRVGPPADAHQAACRQWPDARDLDSRRGSSGSRGRLGVPARGCVSNTSGGA